jgi:DeoR family transcriptional regulator, fructose operon transcriptional repressor
MQNAESGTKARSNALRAFLFIQHSSFCILHFPNMLIAERKSRLKELLARRGMSGLDSLAAELSVSQSTVRRDVEQLEQEGLVERTHGGVIWIGDRRGNGAAGGAGGSDTARPYAFDGRMGYRLDAKQQIARAARRLVQPGQTILVDGGTTTFYFCRELLGQSMQIVTNSLPIANLFLNDDHVELVLTGGQMYPRYGVLLGPVVESFVAGMHASTLFLSAAAINAGSVYNQNLLLVAAEKRMMQQVQQVVLLADGSKFGQQALATLCRLDEVDVVVSDPGMGEAHRQMVKDAGCELVIASEGT